MATPCRLARWVAASGQSTAVPPPESLRVFSASPETHHRLSPGLRGEILQLPWRNHALQPTPWIAASASATRVPEHCVDRQAELAINSCLI